MGCVEHVWKVAGGSFAADAQVESVCGRCGAVTAETRAVLNPGVDTPGLEDKFLDGNVG